MELGSKIRELRQSIGSSQEQLAWAADLSQSYLSQIENGDVKNPSAAALLRLSEAMHVNPVELLEAARLQVADSLRIGQSHTNADSFSDKDHEPGIDSDLLLYLRRFPRDRQRRLLVLLEGLENVMENAAIGGGQGEEEIEATKPVAER